MTETVNKLLPDGSLGTTSPAFQDNDMCMCLFMCRFVFMCVCVFSVAFCDCEHCTCFSELIKFFLSEKVYICYQMNRTRPLMTSKDLRPT